MTTQTRICSITLSVIAATAGLTIGLGRVVADDVKPAPTAEAKQASLRFVALGDTGKGNATQYAVARAMKTACENLGGCAFGLLLGDNIYPSGVASPTDPQLVDKLETPYSILPFPFHLVLGNHDYGSSWEFWKARAQLDYAKSNQKFRMPDRHYAFSNGPATFIAVDTNAIFWGVSTEERSAFRTARTNAHSPWIIGFGHHPYVSNGKHGNAGQYDGVPFGWIPGGGGELESFFQDEVCGKVDLFLAGHDHNLQDLGNHCGTEFVVSGAGASATRLYDRNRREFQATVPGFLLVELDSATLTLRFYNENAKELHRREVRHR